MNIIHQQSSNPTLSPKRVQEKADILETNLFKSISKLTDPSRIQIKINRTNHPDNVITKAVFQLLPRFDITPREYTLKLKELLQKEIALDKQETFEKSIHNSDEELSDFLPIVTRNFEAIVSKKKVEIIISGIPVTQTIHGRIEKTFFNHEQSPGKLLKNGLINFKEINKYPIVNTGEKLFYITHEKAGKHGISFDGKIIPAKEAKPFILAIGSGVEKTDDPDETGKSKGYFLHAKKTGVILLDRNKQGDITGIEVSDEVEVKKLGYSTGNVGTQYACPIHMKIGVICNDFKIRVNGKVEATIVDGGEITTNHDAVILKAQSGSVVMALKDITIGSAIHSKIISEQGVVTIQKELLDSKISCPRMVFKKNRGLITNNKIEAENLTLMGLNFASENIIHFGSNLFSEKKKLIQSGKDMMEDKRKLKQTEKILMGDLQSALKKITKLTLADHDLLDHIKRLIMATKAMDYEMIYKEMDLIQKKKNTKNIATVRKLFESLEKVPQKMKACEDREAAFKDNMNGINQRMASMKLIIEGFLKRTATIKIFCGTPGEKKVIKPDFIAEANGSVNKFIKITGSYSSRNGFEFVQ